MLGYILELVLKRNTVIRNWVRVVQWTTRCSWGLDICSVASLGDKSQIDLFVLVLVSRVVLDEAFYRVTSS